MSDVFQPGQRFLSEAESELGLGIVVSVEARQVELAFPLLEETRRYVIDNAPLLRLNLHPGDTAKSLNGWEMHVASVSRRDSLLHYTGTRLDTGEQVELPEQLLNAHCALNQPRERILAGQAGRNREFELRLDALKRLDTAHRSTHLGLHGPRVALLPHQLYVADQVSRRHHPRVLLADEVGLGKTIEAGMIMHRQLLTQRAGRVLVLVPETLQHQWLVELRRRFNLLFSLVTEESSHPFDESQLIICSLPLMLEKEELLQQALESELDMLVVDEAHHLEWSRERASPAYELVEQLANSAPSVLLLTATPEQLGREGHFARLRLLDPERFYDLDAHLRAEQRYHAVAAAVEPLAEPDGQLSDSQLDTLSVYLQDENSQAMLRAELDEVSRTTLLEKLIDRHGTGRVLFRNTRQSVGGLPKRSLQHHPLASRGHAAGREQLLADWLLQLLKANPSTRYLLICETNDTALELATTLRLRAGIVAAVFCSGMSVLECDRAAAHFADAESGCPILISSAVGSEGRNFQFVNELILFDLPKDPDVLEQRIGRVDRIGQASDVIVHVPTLDGNSDAVLLRWYDEGLDAFSRSCNYGSAVLRQLDGTLDNALTNPADTQLTERLVNQTRECAQSIRHQLESGRDRLLELASTNPSASAELALELEHLDEQPGPWPFVERAADSFGLELEELSAESYSIHIGSVAEQHDFPGLPEGGCSGTDNRELALHREDLEFITWEHPLVRGLLHMVVDGDTGKTAVVALKAQPFRPGEVLLETLFSVQSAAPGRRWQRYLPLTYFRMLHTSGNLDVSAKVPSNWLAMNVKNIDRSTARKLIAAQRDTLANRLTSIENSAHEKLQPITRQAVTSATTHFEEEINRLTELLSLGAPVREIEIESMRSESRNITHSLEHLTPQLQAIRVLFTH